MEVEKNKDINLDNVIKDQDINKYPYSGKSSFAEFRKQSMASLKVENILDKSSVKRLDSVYPEFFSKHNTGKIYSPQKAPKIKLKINNSINTVALKLNSPIKRARQKSISSSYINSEYENNIISRKSSKLPTNFNLDSNYNGLEKKYNFMTEKIYDQEDLLQNQIYHNKQEEEEIKLISKKSNDSLISIKSIRSIRSNKHLLNIQDLNKTSKIKLEDNDNINTNNINIQNQVVSHSFISADRQDSNILQNNDHLDQSSNLIKKNLRKTRKFNSGEYSTANNSRNLTIDFNSKIQTRNFNLKEIVDTELSSSKNLRSITNFNSNKEQNIIFNIQINNNQEKLITFANENNSAIINKSKISHKRSLSAKHNESNTNKIEAIKPSDLLDNSVKINPEPDKVPNEQFKSLLPPIDKTKRKKKFKILSCC